MKKPWYVFGSILILLAVVLSACTGDVDGDAYPAAGTAALATQVGLSTQGVQPLEPLATGVTGAEATGVSAPAQAATSVVATPVPPTQAIATGLAATEAGATPLATANPAAAATQAAAPVVQQNVEQRAYLASNLLDMPVWNTLEGEIADIDGLVVDSATGNVQYALVNENGLHPIPFSMFRVIDTDPTNNTDPTNLDDLALLLPVSQSQLQSAPTIAQADLDAPMVTGWAPGIYNYWAQSGVALPITGQETQAGTPIFVRDAGIFGGIGYDVENYQNEDLGNITNFVVNPDGTINYAIMQTSSFLNMGARRLLVPLKAMVFNPNNRRFLLPVDNNWLDQAINQAGLSDDITPEYFWREDWDAAPAAFWANFQPIQPPPAQGTPGAPTLIAPQTPGAAAQGNAAFSTSRVFDVDVVAPNGDSLGTVSNLAFAGDRLQYVIMRVAQGFAAVPWRAFQWDQANNRLVYNQDISWLAGAPVIASEEVFTGTDYTWEAPIADYWNGYLQGGNLGFRNNASVLYFSQLNNVTLVDGAGVNLGNVTDVLVDGDGRIRYVIVNRNGRLIPVPFNLFRWGPQNNTLAFTGDVARLDGAPSFNNLDDLNLFDPTWDDQAEAFWR